VLAAVEEQVDDAEAKGRGCRRENTNQVKVDEVDERRRNGPLPRRDS